MLLNRLDATLCFLFEATDQIREGHNNSVLGFGFWVLRYWFWSSVQRAGGTQSRNHKSKPKTKPKTETQNQKPKTET
jgi:hypothetical protein